MEKLLWIYFEKIPPKMLKCINIVTFDFLNATFLSKRSGHKQYLYIVHSDSCMLRPSAPREISCILPQVFFVYKGIQYCPVSFGPQMYCTSRM